MISTEGRRSRRWAGGWREAARRAGNSVFAGGLRACGTRCRSTGRCRGESATSMRAGRLVSVEECTEIGAGDGGGFAGEDPAGERRRFDGEELVSMNFWGFSPEVFPRLGEMFAEVSGRADAGEAEGGVLHSERGERVDRERGNGGGGAGIGRALVWGHVSGGSRGRGRRVGADRRGGRLPDAFVGGRQVNDRRRRHHQSSFGSTGRSSRAGPTGADTSTTRSRRRSARAGRGCGTFFSGSITRSSRIRRA